MAYAHFVNRVTFSGTMFGGAEEWSTGFFLGEESAAAEVPTQTMADALLIMWRTFFEDADSSISASYLTTQVKVARLRATDGHVDGDNVVYSYPATELNGASIQSNFPPQCSLVVTLMSDRPRGLASKGRMYIPGVNWAVSGTGKMSASNTNQFSGAITEFFNAVRASTDVPNAPILAAKGTGPVPSLTAQNDYIERIKVGDVYDTQRRRRNGLNEAYITTVLV